MVAKIRRKQTFFWAIKISQNSSSFPQFHTLSLAPLTPAYLPAFLKCPSLQGIVLSGKLLKNDSIRIRKANQDRLQETQSINSSLYFTYHVMYWQHYNNGPDCDQNNSIGVRKLKRKLGECKEGRRWIHQQIFEHLLCAREALQCMYSCPLENLGLLTICY